MNVGTIDTEDRGKVYRTIAVTVAAALVAVGLAGVAPTASASACSEGDVTVHEPKGDLGEQAHVCLSLEIGDPIEIPELQFDCGDTPCGPSLDETPPVPSTPPTPGLPPEPQDRPCDLNDDPCVPAAFSAVLWAAAVAGQEANWTTDTVDDLEAWAGAEADKLEGWGLGNAREIEGWLRSAPWGANLEDRGLVTVTIRDSHVHRDVDAHEPVLDLICTVVFGQGSTWEECEAFIQELTSLCEEGIEDCVDPACDGAESCVEFLVGLVTEEESSSAPGVASTPGLIVKTPEGSVFVPATEIHA